MIPPKKPPERAALDPVGRIGGWFVEFLAEAFRLFAMDREGNRFSRTKVASLAGIAGQGLIMFSESSMSWVEMRWALFFGAMVFLREAVQEER